MHDSMPEDILPLRSAEERKTLTIEMLRKQADMQVVADSTGKNINAMINEAKRQLDQVQKENTLTKSDPSAD